MNTILTPDKRVRLYFLKYIIYLTAVDAKLAANGNLEGEEIVNEDEEFIVRRGNSLSTTSRNSLSRYFKLYHYRKRSSNF